MTDLCGVRWGTHSCRYENDGHLVGVDCECHCADYATVVCAETQAAGYPYYGPDTTMFMESSEPGYGEHAQQNFGHAIRWGPA